MTATEKVPKKRLNWHVGWNGAALLMTMFGIAAVTINSALGSGMLVAAASLWLVAFRSGLFVSDGKYLARGGIRVREVPIAGTSVRVDPAPIRLLYAQTMPGSVAITLAPSFGDPWLVWGAVGFGDPSEVVRRLHRDLSICGYADVCFEVSDEDPEPVSELVAAGVDVTLRDKSSRR